MTSESQDIVVCKICEKPTRANHLVTHSAKCKETAECREKYISVKTNLLSIIDNAYTLKNQLNTSVAIQKSKMQHLFYQDESSNFINSPIPFHKRKPNRQISYLEDEAAPLTDRPHTAQHRLYDLSSEHKSEEFSKDSADQKEGRHPKKHFHFDFDMLDDHIEMPKKPMLPHQKLERRSSLAITPGGKMRLEAGMSLDEKYNKIHDEFNKSVLALKKILHYGKNLQASLEELEEEDATREIQIKNEINILYSAILDKKISEYLKQFLNIIQEYITVKRNYFKKVSALEKLHRELENEFMEAVDDEVQETRPNPKKKGFKRYATLVDCFYTSELGEENTSDNSFSSETPGKKDSAANIPNVKNIISIRNQLTGLSTLSRFATIATSKKQSEDPKEKLETIPSRTSSRYTSYKEEESIASCKSKMTRDNSQHRNRFIRPLEKNIEEPMVRLRKYSGSRFDRKDSDELAQIDVSTPERDDMKNFVKLRSRQPIVIQRLNVDYEEKTLSTNSSLASTPLRLPPSRQQSNFKPAEPSKPKLTRRLSLDNMRNFEDINDLKNKNFPSLHNVEKDENYDEPQDINILDDSSKESTKDKKEEEVKKQPKKYRDIVMKGYYSDSTLDEARSRKVETKKKEEVGIDDFEFLKMIGQGAFGKIYLVRKKATGDKYAMKIVDLVDNETTHNKIRSLQAEKDVYASIKGDWVVKAFYTFTYQNYVCFALEYMPGGDFIHILEQVGCFEESIARFYFAELVLAVESLHALGIVHRDLKPDNILIDDKGHLKLTDFGLSEKGVDTRLRKLTTSKKITVRPSMRAIPPSFMDLNLEPLETEIQKSQSRLFAPTIAELPDSVVIVSLKELDAQYHRSSKISDTTDEYPLQKKRSGTIDEYPIQKKRNEEEVIFAFLGDNYGSLNNRIKLPLNFGALHDHNPLPATKVPVDNGILAKKKEVYRIVGTPDYMAPEIIRGENCQNKSVDLWSLGVMLYEFLVGIPPFNAETVDEIFENIKEMKIEWPSIGYGEDQISPEAVDLIKKLLNHKNKSRLTIRQIKSHPFFKSFDWSRVKCMTPPMVPPEQKESSSPGVSIMPKNIFKINVEDKFMNKGISPTHMNGFNMKRIDLLHQLNEQTYDSFRSKIKMEAEAELSKEKIESETKNWPKKGLSN